MSLQLKESYVIIILVLALGFPYVFAIFISRGDNGSSERLSQMEETLKGMKTLEKALEDERSQNSEMRDEYHRSRAAQLQREGELQQSLAELRQELVPKVSALQEEKDLLAKKLLEFDAMTKTVSQLNRQLEENTVSLKKAEADLAKIQEVADERLAKIETLEKEKATLTAKAKEAESLKGEMEKLNSKIQTEAAVKGDLLTQISQLEKDLAKAQENPELAAAETQIAQLEEGMRKMESRHQYAEAVKGDLLRQISRLQKQVEETAPATSVNPDHGKEVSAWMDLQMQSQERLVEANRMAEERQRRIKDLEYALKDSPIQAAAANLMNADLPPSVQDPGELNIRAVPLVQTIKAAKRDELPVSERDSLIQKRNLGKLAARVPINSAESPLPLDQADAIRSAIRETNGQSYFVAVSYADPAEKEPVVAALERAGVLTKFVKPLLPEGASVQAVQVGATSQFNEEDPKKNRVVELWLVP